MATSSTSLLRHWLSILFVTIMTFSVGAIVTFIQPMEYRSSFTVLLVEKDNTLDGYAASKSAERLTLSLAQLLGTGAFSDTLYAEFKGQNTYENNPLFAEDKQVRQDEWKKRIETRTQPEAGLLRVNVYQTDDKQAQDVATALSTHVAGNTARQYLGGKNLELQIVDYPLTSKRPVRPNIPVNLAVSILLGLAGSVAFHFLRGLAQSELADENDLADLYVPQPSAAPEAKPEPAQTPPAIRPVASPDHAPDIPLDRVYGHKLHEPVKRQAEEALASMAVPGFGHQPPRNLPVDDEWVMP